MEAFRNQKKSIILALLVGAAVLSGCSESQQEKYQDAMQQVKQAKENRQDVKQTLNKKKKTLAKAQDAVREARNQYQQAQQEVKKASNAVDKVITDPMLFRTIQRKVTQEEPFDNSAISVSVNNRVVRLSGTVPNDDVRQKALKLARSQPGVKNVVGSLRVKQSQAGGTANQNGTGDHKSGS